MSAIESELAKQQALLAAKLLHSYLECGDVIQAGIRKMLDVIDDPATDEDDRVMALHSLAEALFPNFHDGKLGIDLVESEAMGASVSEEAKHAIETMDREEATFAERLATVMQEKGLSQESLARMVGVGQPAISNMLNRRARPQRATVKRFAGALGVPPSQLWPGIDEDQPSH